MDFTTAVFCSSNNYGKWATIQVQADIKRKVKSKNDIYNIQ